MMITGRQAARELIGAIGGRGNLIRSGANPATGNPGKLYIPIPPGPFGNDVYGGGWSTTQVRNDATGQMVDVVDLSQPLAIVKDVPALSGPDELSPNTADALKKLRDSGYQTPDGNYNVENLTRGNVVGVSYTPDKNNPGIIDTTQPVAVVTRGTPPPPPPPPFDWNQAEKTLAQMANAVKDATVDTVNLLKGPITKATDGVGQAVLPAVVPALAGPLEAASPELAKARKAYQKAQQMGGPWGGLISVGTNALVEAAIPLVQKETGLSPNVIRALIEN